MSTPICECGSWRDIASAPKDGTEILVFDEGALYITSWLDDEGHDGVRRSGWYDNGFVEPPPTHWQPLPPPPADRIDPSSAPNAEE